MHVHLEGRLREQKGHFFFVPYDSDEDLPAESVQDRLGWRLSPEESLSDWTIQIVYNKTDCDGNISNKTDTYHVHPYFLVVGHRKGEYFVRLFQDGGRFAESETQTSCIEFDEIAAKAFPLLLDFLYSPEAELQLTTENATALHSMAKYSDIRYLRRKTNEFWRKDMTIATCGTYYEHAWILQVRRSSRLLPQHVPKHHGNQEFDPSCPRSGCKILACLAATSAKITNAFSRHMFSRHVSTLIAEFYRQNKVDATTFKELTDGKYLPTIHPDAALPLMETERESPSSLIPAVSLVYRNDVLMPSLETGGDTVKISRKLRRQRSCASRANSLSARSTRGQCPPQRHTWRTLRMKTLRMTSWHDKENVPFLHCGEPYKVWSRGNPFPVSNLCSRWSHVREVLVGMVVLTHGKKEWIVFM